MAYSVGSKTVADEIARLRTIVAKENERFIVFATCDTNGRPAWSVRREVLYDIGWVSVGALHM